MTDLGSARPSVEASGAARASDRETTARGWTHLLLGVVILVSGVGVLAGNVAARAVAVVLAGLSALVNLAFIEAYPIWSILIITVDVLVIYALTVHGGERDGDPVRAAAPAQPEEQP